MFAKFSEVIMEWTHVDTLQMGPPSTKWRVGNVVKVVSKQEVIESIIDTEGEKIKSIVEMKVEET